MFWRCSPLYFFSERKVNWATFSWGTSFATKIIFAFDHINYYHFLPVQYVSWEYLQMSKPDVIFKPDVWLDFMQNAFIGSVGGEQFSIILWDLITKTTINREVKVTGGPLHGSRNNSRIILPFLEAPDWHFKSGVQIEESIVDGLLGKALWKSLSKIKSKQQVRPR